MVVAAPDNPIYREVRLAAIADARQRADDYAAAFGATVSELVEVSDLDGGFAPMPRRMSAKMEMAADMGDASFAFEPAVQTVSGQVTVRFTVRVAGRPDRAEPAVARCVSALTGTGRNTAADRFSSMFAKVLVANRGEIAVRAFRAAYELGAQTVAVYPYEDRNAVHRIKADEAYQIGERGHPVRAYLDIDEIIRAARQSGADAIYPGYGFLSENPELARACERAGITFIGPPADVLELAGNKVRALEAARAAGIPTLKSTPPSADLDELVAGAEEIGFPVFVKAVAGGGGRGMRRVDDPAAAARGGAGGDARGRGRVRRPDGVHRAGGRPAAAHRGADPGRHPGQHDAPVRAGLLDPAAAPEGGRDRPGAAHLRGAAGRRCAPTR